MIGIPFQCRRLQLTLSTGELPTMLHPGSAPSVSPFTVNPKVHHCPDFQLSHYLSDETPSYEEVSMTGRKVNQFILTKFSSQDELCVCVLTQSCLTLCYPVACSLQGSMVFPRQEYWSRLPSSPPGDLPDPGIKPVYPALAGRFLPLHHLRSPGWADTLAI